VQAKFPSRSDIKAWIERIRPFTPAVVAALAGIALSVFAWFVVAGREDAHAYRKFARSAADNIQILQTGLDEYVEKLVALRALFNASQGGVSREQFNVFTRDLADGHTAILSFSWAPRVTDSERPGHEAEGRRQGIPEYGIKSVLGDGLLMPAPKHDEYFPVFYSKGPPTREAFGIDLKDGGVREQPLSIARDGNLPSTSVRFRLQTGFGNRSGFFVVLPVYRDGMAPYTIEDRRRDLIGFVQGVFQFHVMVDSILAGLKSPLNLLMFDAASSADALPVYVHGDNGERFRFMSRVQAMASKRNWYGDLNVGDRYWRVVAIPPAVASTFAQHSRAWIVALAGLLVSAMAVAYVWASIRNVRRLKAVNGAVSALARTDPLTGLPNRRAFIEQLAPAFARTARGHAPFAVQFIDLDYFKDINDTQGHATGDALLREVAVRLASVVRTNDIVARFGGDEFAILQSDVGDNSAAAMLAGKVIKLLSEPYQIGGAELHITASIGIAPYTERVDGPSEIMMQADLALYRAKDDGRGRFRFHSRELDHEVDLRVNLAEELRGAIARNELELLYQTQVEIQSGRIVGLEALVRWNHPVRGLILPAVFVPIAEQTGMIEALGSWVLARACRQYRQWRDAGITVPLLAINVSGAQLRREPEFALDVTENFLRWEIPPQAIEFELTESILMEMTEKQSDTLDHLQQLGATIAIDDFGTGYSSLKYLTTYPVHRLKIAGELVSGIISDSRSAVVVRSTIRLARDLGIECIAEGVENADEARFLLEAGCKYAQGYHYSRPMPAAAAADLMRQQPERGQAKGRTDSAA
jgi:diguanylate cyclase (GGDEF)-like protein